MAVTVKTSSPPPPPPDLTPLDQGRPPVVSVAAEFIVASACIVGKDGIGFYRGDKIKASDLNPSRDVSEWVDQGVLVPIPKPEKASK